MPMQKSALQEFEAKLVLLPTLKIGPRIYQIFERSEPHERLPHPRQTARSPDFPRDM